MLPAQALVEGSGTAVLTGHVVFAGQQNWDCTESCLPPYLAGGPPQQNFLLWSPLLDEEKEEEEGEGSSVHLTRLIIDKCEGLISC